MGGNNQINHSKIKIDLRNCTPISSAYTFCKADSETIINLFWIDIPNRDVIGFTTAYAINIYIYHHVVNVHPIMAMCTRYKHYGIIILSTLWQVGDFLRVSRFTSPIKLTAKV